MQLINALKRRMLSKRGIIVGPQSSIAKNAILEPPVSLGEVIVSENVTIGKHSYINSGKVWPNCAIGRYCSISYNVLIGPPDHPTNFLTTMDRLYKNAPYYTEVSQKKTEIGNDIWIGANSLIRNGVKVGDGAVVAAGAIVIEDVPKFSIVGGVPARILKYRFEPEIISKLVVLKWWDLNDKIIQDLPFNDIHKCISIIEQQFK